jgi:hypothetical protein
MNVLRSRMFSNDSIHFAWVSILSRTGSTVSLLILIMVRSPCIGYLLKCLGRLLSVHRVVSKALVTAQSTVRQTNTETPEKRKNRGDLKTVINSKKWIHECPSHYSRRSPSPGKGLRRRLAVFMCRPQVSVNQRH